jgi:hypothetical protein
MTGYSRIAQQQDLLAATASAAILAMNRRIDDFTRLKHDLGEQGLGGVDNARYSISLLSNRPPICDAS